jgi:cephalosporin hydroxylase
MRIRQLRPLLAVLALISAACNQKTTPAEPITEMRMSEPLPEGRVHGVYDRTESWRYTARVFEFSLDLPRTGRAVYLDLEMAVPHELFDAARSVTMIATVNGVEAGRQRFDEPGQVRFTRYVPQAALTASPAAVRFEIDHAIKGALDGREQGVIAVSVGLKEYEETSEYRDAQSWLTRLNSGKVTAQISKDFPTAKVVELRKLFFALPATQKVDFQGIAIDRNPLDLWNMQQVAFEVRPKFVIDTRTREGGAALYWAQVLHTLGGGARVITIDRQNRATKAAEHSLWKEYVEFVEGDLTAPDVLGRITERVKGGSVLAVVDAGQEAAVVLDAIRAYAPLVTRGSYLAVENTGIDSDPAGRLEGAGPAEAVRRFLAEGGDRAFEVDASRDMFVLTSSPGGWLRRK